MTRVTDLSRILPLFFASVLCALMPWSGARAQTKHYRFGYDQPRTTAFGVAGDMFDAKLRALSHGAMAIDQFPSAQLGQEPQLLQLLKSGDLDFAITSTANSATIAPEAGVLSLHFLFRSDDQLQHALADPKLIAAVKRLYADTVVGTRALALATLGLRSMYGAKEVHSLADLAGAKVRVQATATEDTLFAAYGAQTVHMPFGSVYTSLQTGVMELAENGVNVYVEQQALRGRPDPVVDPARGEQQHPVGQRPAVGQRSATSRRAGCRRPPTRWVATSRPRRWRWTATRWPSCAASASRWSTMSTCRGCGASPGRSRTRSPSSSARTRWRS